MNKDIEDAIIGVGKGVMKGMLGSLTIFIEILKDEEGNDKEYFITAFFLIIKIIAIFVGIAVIGWIFTL